ncbi:hypothetical protein MBLNU457_6178t1 [Dothideomycetes sp. NU457]
MLLPTYASVQSLLIASLALETALAVSLNDFTPRVSNLPSACESIYTSQISGCQPSDFSGSGCSQSCINAFNRLQPAISSACQGVTGQNVLVAFMAGSGTKNLCPNAAIKSSPAPPQPAPTTSTTAPESTAAQSTQQTTSIATSSMTAAAPTTTSQAAVIVVAFTSTASAIESSSASSTPRATTIVSTATVMPSPDAPTMTATDAAPSTLIFNTAVPPTASASLADTTISDVPAQATSGGQGSPFDAYSGRKSSAATIEKASSWTVLVAVIVALIQIV